MRLFVISLRRSVERRRVIGQALDAAGVEYSFFEGVDLQRDRNRYFHHCDDERFLLHTGRPPAVGELGCFASHLLLWRTCRLLNEPLVILEDDAEPAADFRDALALVERYVHPFGFIRLQECNKKALVPIAGTAQWRIAYCTRYPHGAAAYAISPTAADRLIRQSDVVRAPVDVFIKRYWRHGQPLHALQPGVVSLGEASGASTIELREPQRLAPGKRWRRFWLQRRDWMERGLFNLRWLRRHARRPVRRALRGAAAAAVFQKR